MFYKGLDGTSEAFQAIQSLWQVLALAYEAMSITDDRQMDMAVFPCNSISQHCNFDPHMLHLSQNTSLPLTLSTFKLC